MQLRGRQPPIESNVTCILSHVLVCSYYIWGEIEVTGQGKDRVRQFGLRTRRGEDWNAWILQQNDIYIKIRIIQIKKYRHNLRVIRVNERENIRIKENEKEETEGM